MGGRDQIDAALFSALSIALVVGLLLRIVPIRPRVHGHGG